MELEKPNFGKSLFRKPPFESSLIADVPDREPGDEPDQAEDDELSAAPAVGDSVFIRPLCGIKVAGTDHSHCGILWQDSLGSLHCEACQPAPLRSDRTRRLVAAWYIVVNWEGETAGMKVAWEKFTPRYL